MTEYRIKLHTKNEPVVHMINNEEPMIRTPYGHDIPEIIVLRH